MEREALISRKLLDAQNELNNSLNCAPAYYSSQKNTRSIFNPQVLVE